MLDLNDSVYFRYFFFQWLFKDANVNELYQRSAAIAHNKANRHHLIAYLRRWVILALSMYLVGAGLEYLNLLACVFFYTVASLAACTIAKITAAYLLLGRSDLR